MKTTTDYLDAIKARHDLPSDYALAKLLGCSRSGISGYRSGRTSFDDDTALRVARLLDVDPLEVLLSAHAERAKAPEARAQWERALSRLPQTGAGVCVMSTSDGTPARRWTDRIPSFVPLIPPALRNRSSHPSFCIA